MYSVPISIDNDGRIKIPDEFLLRIGAGPGTRFHIRIRKNSLILIQAEEEPSCIFCRSRKEIITCRRSVPVCRVCAAEVAERHGLTGSSRREGIRWLL